MRLFTDNQYWQQVRDGNPVALKLFESHYSKYHYADGRRPKLFVGPGEKIVLLGIDGQALFAWRKFISGDGQEGVNCAIFINRSKAHQSSDLILQAEEIALRRWPGVRFYTYVNPRKIASANPGYCFKCAGWRPCGITKRRQLIILEKLNA